MRTLEGPALTSMEGAFLPPLRGRSSAKWIQMPLVRKAISRKRSVSVEKLNSVSPKMSVSGLNQVVVPVCSVPLLLVLRLPTAFPRSYSWR